MITVLLSIPLFGSRDQDRDFHLQVSGQDQDFWTRVSGQDQNFGILMVSS